MSARGSFLLAREIVRNRRAARMLFDARHPRCCCETPADPDLDGRCSRCYGEVER